jgi:hypothetical protein
MLSPNRSRSPASVAACSALRSSPATECRWRWRPRRWRRRRRGSVIDRRRRWPPTPISVPMMPVAPAMVVVPIRSCRHSDGVYRQCRHDRQSDRQTTDHRSLPSVGARETPDRGAPLSVDASILPLS